MSETETELRSVDYGAGQLAKVYARALLGAAEKTGDVDRVQEELLAFAVETVEKHPELRLWLGSPRVSTREKQELFDRVLGGRVSPVLVDFLKVVARHERLDFLREIAFATRDLVHDLRGRLRVQVKTAEPLSAELRERITQGLSQSLQKQVVLEESVDPALLGGLVVRVGDQVIDGSVSYRLESMRQEALRRTRQEIQNNSERFAAV